MSVYISNLPEYTGNTYNGYFVWNDSGETTTYKTKYLPTLKPGSGTDSAVSLNLTPAFAPNNYMFIYGSHSTPSSGDYSSVIGGLNNRTESSYGGVIGGQQNIAGFRSFVAGGFSNYANGNGAAIVGGENNLASNVSAGGIFGSLGSKIYGGNDFGFSIFGGGYNVVGSNGGRGLFAIGGAGNRVQNFRGTSDAGRFVYGGIVGGESNYIGNDRTAPDTNTAGQNAYPLILGGYYNTILAYSDGSGDPNWYNTILNGDNSSISGATTGGTIINSTNTIISGKTRATMIGTSGRTALYDNTTHTENIHTYKTETFDVIAGGNVGGNIDVDCSLGTIYTFTMTANTTPNFINLRTGQRFIFIVDNTTYNVPDATINGVSGNVYAKNGSISPSSNATTKYTATFDGTRLFLDEEGGFSAV